MCPSLNREADGSPGASADEERSGAARPRVVIAGVGLVTPLGVGAWATFRALLGGRTVSDRLSGLEEGTEAVALARAIGGVASAGHGPTDPTVELAERAGREAAGEAGVALAGLPTWVGASKGAVGTLAAGRWPLAVGSDASGGGLQQAVEAVVHGPHGYLSHHLRRRMGIDLRGCAVAACASSLVALDQARRWLIAEPAAGGQRPAAALILTAESALTPLFIHSYRRLGVLAPLTVHDYHQRPLDERRGGFVLAAAGAAVLLRRLPLGEAPRPGQVELVDTATACEAYDMIRPAPGQPALRHVAERLFHHRDIAVLHPHAPGTLEHDPGELAALAAALASSSPDPRPSTQHPATYANKGTLGHSLGSSGLVSLVLAALAARVGRLPRMPWLDRPLVDVPLPLNAAPYIDADRRHACHAVFASGFAGHVAGAVLRLTP